MGFADFSKSLSSCRKTDADAGVVPTTDGPTSADLETRTPVGVAAGVLPLPLTILGRRSSRIEEARRLKENSVVRSADRLEATAIPPGVEATQDRDRHR